MNGRLRRRMVSVPAVVAGALLLTPALVLLVPCAVAVDLVTLRRRLPLTRLVAFAWWWTVAETLGVVAAGWLFITGRRTDHAAHYVLMRRWAAGLMVGMRRCLGADVAVVGAKSLSGGRALVLSRHVSLADSLLSAWAITSQGLNPRYVLKKELLADPCLDVVGCRIPNHFVDREADDAESELRAIARLTDGVSTSHDTVVVIFPEGTRANQPKRTRALEKLSASAPARAERLSGLRTLLPVRPAGTIALMSAAPDLDVVCAWHIGLDGMDTFGGMWRRLSAGVGTIELHFERHLSQDLPGDEDRLDWLDERWLEMDRKVSERVQQGS